MIKKDKRGRKSNNKNLANFLHNMTAGDVVRVTGQVELVKRLANSLSRTHKRNNKTTFAIRTIRSNKPTITITCINHKKHTSHIIL